MATPAEGDPRSKSLISKTLTYPRFTKLNGRRAVRGCIIKLSANETHKVEQVACSLTDFDYLTFLFNNIDRLQILHSQDGGEVGSSPDNIAQLLISET